MKKARLQVFSFCRLLVPVMLIIVMLVSCSSPGSNSTVTTQQQTVATTDATTESPLTIEKNDYKNYEFNIQTYIRTSHEFDYFGGIGNESGDTLNDAVFKRNLKVEDHLGVKIISTPVTTSYKTMASDLKNASASGTYSYDMICTALTSMTSIALEGGFYDIAELDAVDLENPWWDDALNSAFSLDNRQYYISGDAVTINYDGTYIMRFNQDLAAEHQLNPSYFYNLVKEGKWTIEKMLEVAADFVSENGDGIVNYDDSFGTVAVNTFTQALWYGSGLQLISKDDSDMPVFSAYDEKIQNAYEKIVSVFAAPSTYNTQPKANRMSGLNHAGTADAMLLTGKALFQSTILESMIRTNDSETKVGILPIPKSAEAQESYYCIVNPSGLCSAIALPNFIEDKERTADVLETMMYYSSEYIRPAYFDTVLQYKVLDDMESYEILGIILSSRVAPDLGVIYEWGGLMGAIQTSAAACQPSIQTTYTAVSNLIEKELASLRIQLNK